MAVSQDSAKRAAAKLVRGQTYDVDVSNFADLDVIDQIGVIKQGVGVGLLENLARQMEIPKDRLTAYLGIPRSTLGRKAKAQSLLSSEQSERVLGVVRLVDQVKDMVEQSGVRDFNAAQWISQWLEEPNPALDGRKPSEFMDTNLGQQLVSNLLARMQSGAYS